MSGLLRRLCFFQHRHDAAILSFLTIDVAMASVGVSSCAERVANTVPSGHHEREEDREAAVLTSTSRIDRPAIGRKSLRDSIAGSDTARKEYSRGGSTPTRTESPGSTSNAGKEGIKIYGSRRSPPARAARRFPRAEPGRWPGRPRLLDHPRRRASPSLLQHPESASRRASATALHRRGRDARPSLGRLRQPLDHAVAAAFPTRWLSTPAPPARRTRRARPPRRRSTGCPGRSSRTRPMAAFAAEATDDEPRTSMISAPRPATRG